MNSGIGDSIDIFNSTYFMRLLEKVITWSNMLYDERIEISNIALNYNTSYKTVKDDVNAFRQAYPKPVWAITQVLRESGLVEDICKDGVGHPNAGWLKKHDPIGKYSYGVHGCDGCCMED